MIGDYQITSDEAQQLQAEVSQLGEALLMWVITYNTKDYGNLWVARPQAVTRTTAHSFPFVLLAQTRDGIRTQLPPNLTLLQRYPDDDPVIIEVWL